MNRAKRGDRVKIHYTEKLNDSKILDTSKGKQALEITIGSNIVPIFEDAVKDMGIGQKKIIKVPPTKAYGPRRKELVFKLKKRNLPGLVSPAVGMRVKFHKPNGDQIHSVIKNINGDTITFDANHPLSGKSFIFEIELIEIN